MRDVDNQPLLSVVVPAFNEAANVPVLYDRLCAALADLDGEWELIVVDDHSSDMTFDVLTQLAADHAHVKALRMARNGGSHSAAMCAFGHARGRCVVLLAADLQDPPEVIPQLIERWRAGDQVVWAARRARHGERATTLACAWLYYFVMRHVVGVKSLPPKGVDFFLLDERVAATLCRCTERNVSIVPLISWLGFSEGCVEYDKQPRLHGTSGWSLAKKLKLFVDSVTSFSFVPVRAMSYCGCAVTLAGMIMACVVLMRALLGNPVAGQPSLLIAILVIGGVQMVMMGILGEYLWRTFDEARGRPRFVIERTLNLKAEVTDPTAPLGETARMHIAGAIQ